MVASFIHPHDPYVARKEFWDLYNSEDIDMPKHTVDDVTTDPFSKRLRDGIETSTVEVTDEEIRNARHAYYANTSYFDSKIGELVQTLEDTDMLKDTIVIVTSDHGDMLGERGLWYKMNFFEHSVRIPMIMAGPNIANGVVHNACSLLDMLPTMIDIAASEGQEKPAYGQAIDGRSILPLTTGDSKAIEADADEAIAEYCAEMTSYPVYMIR